MALEEILGGFPLTFPPLVESWLEQTLEELSHASESCSSVEEVKFLIIFFIFFVSLAFFT